MFPQPLLLVIFLIFSIISTNGSPTVAGSNHVNAIKPHPIATMPSDRTEESQEFHSAVEDMESCSLIDDNEISSKSSSANADLKTNCDTLRLKRKSSMKQMNSISNAAVKKRVSFNEETEVREVPRKEYSDESDIYDSKEFDDDFAIDLNEMPGFLYDKDLSLAGLQSIRGYNSMILSWRYVERIFFSYKEAYNYVVRTKFEAVRRDREDFRRIVLVSNRRSRTGITVQNWCAFL